MKRLATMIVLLLLLFPALMANAHHPTMQDGPSQVSLPGRPTTDTPQPPAQPSENPAGGPPADATPKADASKSYMAADLGFRFDYPASWSDFTTDAPQSIEVAHADDSSLYITVFVEQEEITNLASFARFYFDPTDAIEPVRIDGQLLAEFSFTIDAQAEDASDNAVSIMQNAEIRQSANPSADIAGRGMAFYLEAAGAGVIITIQSTDVTDLGTVRSLEPAAIDRLYDQLRQSLRFFPVDGPPAPPDALPTQTFSSPDFGFALAYPIIWDDMRYDDEQDWFSSLDTSGTNAIYVYNAGPSDSPQTAGEIIIDRFKMTQQDDFAPISVDGYDGVTFSVSYKFNGTWYGKAAAFVVDGMGLVFSVEMLAEEAVVGDFFERFIASVELP